MSVENVIFTPCFQALLSWAAFRSMSSLVPWYDVNGVSVEARKMPFWAIELVVLLGEGEAVLDRPEPGLDGPAGAVGSLHVARHLEPGLRRPR